MSNSTSDKPSIVELSIANPETGDAVDLKGGMVELTYYESILSNHVTASLLYGDTGNTIGEGRSMKGLLDGLPVRGGEMVRIRAKDRQNNRLECKDDNVLHVNRVKDVVQDTTSSVGVFDLCTKEFLTNEQTRVPKRYSGKISDSVTSILDDVLETPKPKDIEATANSYNFIGNGRKPFFVLTWLAGKSIPEDGSYGNTAGYFFYETQDGYQFKSAETLIGPTQGGGSADASNAKKFFFSDSKDGKNGFDKILRYKINSNIDVHEKLAIGTYCNVTHFWNPFTFILTTTDFDMSEQDGEVRTAGTDMQFVAEEFRQPNKPTRGMTAVLDVGTLPTGEDAEEQCERWKENPDETNDKISERMVQGIMRYNQIFSISTDVLIEADFSLKAGDSIICEFPDLSAKTDRVSQKTSGYYLIASLSHKITGTGAYTSLNLVRDSFGRNPSSISSNTSQMYN